MVGDSERCTGCKGPHFYKVLLESSQDELRIPPAFAHYIKRESSYATLDSQAVKKWRVTLTADGDGLLFKNGWREFFEHHDLAVGDFLLFRYNGNMHFTVRIFGRSCCEDMYVISVDDEDATETLRRPVWPSTRKPEDSEDDSCIVARRPRRVSGKIVKKPQLKPAGECTVFLPGIEGNPSFQFVLKRGRNYIRSFAYIPHKFVKRYMDKRVLACPPVTISLYNPTDPTVGKFQARILRNNSTDYRISAGWMAFCRRSKLKCGDKCIFEVNNERTGFNVHVDRFKPEYKR